MKYVEKIQIWLKTDNRMGTFTLRLKCPSYCRLHKCAKTHWCETLNIFILLTVTRTSTIQENTLLCLHYNNVYANGPQRYFVHTSPILFTLRVIFSLK